MLAARRMPTVRASAEKTQARPAKVQVSIKL